MNTDRLALPGILLRATVVHIVTYFVAGLLALTLLD